MPAFYQGIHSCWSLFLNSSRDNASLTSLLIMHLRPKACVYAFPEKVQLGRQLLRSWDRAWHQSAWYTYLSEKLYFHQRKTSYQESGHGCTYQVAYCNLHVQSVCAQVFSQSSSTVYFKSVGSKKYHWSSVDCSLLFFKLC